MRTFHVAALAVAAGAFWLAAPTAHAAEPSPAPGWTWEISVDGIYAERSKTPGTVIGRDVGLLNPFIQADDFDFDGEFGGDARLRLRHDALAFEARYFGGFDFGSAIGGDAPLDWFFAGDPGIPFGGPPATFTTSYDSRIHSAEANVRWYTHPQFIVFAGVRWLELKESFGLQSIGVDFLMQTKNRGFGPQIGFDWRAVAPSQAGGFFLDLDARLAVLFADQDAAFRVTGGWNFTGGGGTGRNIPAAELGVTVGWQVTPNAEWRLGYRALYLDRVALAPAQMESFDFSDGTVNVAHNDLWIHGVTFGFALRH